MPHKPTALIRHEFVWYLDRVDTALVPGLHKHVVITKKRDNTWPTSWHAVQYIPFNHRVHIPWSDWAQGSMRPVDTTPEYPSALTNQPASIASSRHTSPEKLYFGEVSSHCVMGCGILTNTYHSKSHTLPLPDYTASTLGLGWPCLLESTKTGI